jgi:AraC-like DNA-binding protein
MLIYDGEAVFTRNDKTFKATKGDIIFYTPGDFRKAYTFPDKLMKCFAADFIYTCPTFTDGKWSMNNYDLPLNPIERINDPYLYSRLIDLFTGLSKMWLSKKKDNLIKERAVFTEILFLILQYKDYKDYTYSDMRKVEQIVAFITEHYTDKITLETICKKMQLSPSYLGNIFKKVTGKSIIEYVIHLRITKAKDLLRDGCSVTDTAKMVGFNDIYYFSKAFKKYEVITPSQFSRDFQNNSL